MPSVYLSVGTNIERRKNLKKCLTILRKRFGIIKSSSIYRTSPVGFPKQPYFYNMALKIRTELPPKELLSELLLIEKSLKRIRIKKNHPRTIDIDILFYDKRVIKSKELVIPHPRLHKRAFVLVPLNEIVPRLEHPVLNKSIACLFNALKTSESIRKITPRR